jgi:hypothetical protein
MAGSEWPCCPFVFHGLRVGITKTTMYPTKRPSTKQTAIPISLAMEGGLFDGRFLVWGEL